MKYRFFNGAISKYKVTCMLHLDSIFNVVSEDI